MAKAGNHGIIIPRDKALMLRLYRDENKTLTEIGALYGVTHKSVERVFRDLGIPRRKVGKSRHKSCVKCGGKIHRIKHAGNGAKYGKLCKEHWQEHRAKLARDYEKPAFVKEREREYLKNYYFTGPKNPKGEIQWLNKCKTLLRNARRLSQKPRNLEVSPLLNGRFARALTSQT